MRARKNKIQKKNFSISKYLAFTLMLFSLSLSSGNASATTPENIEKFNKDQFMDYVRMLDNVETNQTNCDMLHGVQSRLSSKEFDLQLKDQLSVPEQLLITEKVRDYRLRCENFWKNYYESKKK